MGWYIIQVETIQFNCISTALNHHYSLNRPNIYDPTLTPSPQKEKEKTPFISLTLFPGMVRSAVGSIIHAEY